MSFYKFENNRKIGTIFRRVSKELAMTGNKFKARAFDRALQSMEYNHKTEITVETVKSLIELKNVGRSAIGLMEKILNGEEVEILKPEQRQRVSSLEILTTLYGVGLSAANKWYDAGIHNLDELRQAHSTKKIKLTSAQVLGLQYYDDLQLFFNEYYILMYTRQNISQNAAEFLISNSSK